MLVLTLVLLSRLFTLQVVNGKEYLQNFTLKIEKTRTIDGNRGDIYDVNGILLATNELSYTITIEDNGSYSSTSEKNRLLNEEFATLIGMLEANGDDIIDGFGIAIDEGGRYYFNVEGTALQRFRADIFGRSKITDLTYNKRYEIDEATATPEQIVNYLCDKRIYDIRLEGTEADYVTAPKEYSFFDKLLGRDKVSSSNTGPEYK